jgi:hypothetical protein
MRSTRCSIFRTSAEYVITDMTLWFWLVLMTVCFSWYWINAFWIEKICGIYWLVEKCGDFTPAIECGLGYGFVLVPLLFITIVVVITKRFLVRLRGSIPLLPLDIMKDDVGIWMTRCTIMARDLCDCWLTRHRYWWMFRHLRREARGLSKSGVIARPLYEIHQLPSIWRRQMGFRCRVSAILGLVVFLASPLQTWVSELVANTCEKLGKASYLDKVSFSEVQVCPPWTNTACVTLRPEVWAGGSVHFYDDDMPPAGRLRLRFDNWPRTYRVLDSISADQSFSIIGTGELTVYGTVVEIKYKYRDENTWDGVMEMQYRGSSLCGGKSIELAIIGGHQGVGR